MEAILPNINWFGNRLASQYLSRVRPILRDHSLYAARCRLGEYVGGGGQPKRHDVRAAPRDIRVTMFIGGHGGRTQAAGQREGAQTVRVPVGASLQRLRPSYGVGTSINRRAVCID